MANRLKVQPKHFVPVGEAVGNDGPLIRGTPIHGALPFCCRVSQLRRMHRSERSDHTGWRRWDSNPRPPACKYARAGRWRTLTSGLASSGLPSERLRTRAYGYGCATYAPSRLDGHLVNAGSRRRTELDKSRLAAWLDGAAVHPRRARVEGDDDRTIEPQGNTTRG
jgi:hypothetical protein